MTTARLDQAMPIDTGGATPSVAKAVVDGSGVVDAHVVRRVDPGGAIRNTIIE